MDETARRRKRQLAEFAAVAAFFAVLVCTPWIVQLASLAILRLDPGAAPDSFPIIYRTVDDRYVATGWPGYPHRGAANGFKSFRLAEPAGFINGPKVQYSFRVLEDDGSRQLIEAQSHGMVRAVSRYAVQGERIEPISYRSLIWGHGQEDPRSLSLSPALIATALGILAAWGVFAAAVRLTRLQQT